MASDSEEETTKGDNPLIIPEEDIEVCELIGEGALASVYRAKWKGVDVAIKMVNERIRLRPTGLYEQRIPDALASIWKEMTIMCQLFHPNIVQMFGMTSKDKKNMGVGLVMELMQTSLFHLVHYGSGQEPSLPYGRVARLLQDVARALAFMHSRDVLHRDLSSRNVLLKKEFIGYGSGQEKVRWVAKVADYAASKSIHDLTSAPLNWSLSTSGHCGTMPYLPLEASEPDPVTGKIIYTPSADVYSFGVVALEAFLRETPGRTFHFKLKYLDKLGSSHPFYGLLRQCLDSDRSKRPSSEEVLSRITCCVNDNPNEDELAVGETNVKLRHELVESQSMLTRLRQENEKLIRRFGSNSSEGKASGDHEESRKEEEEAVSVVPFEKFIHAVKERKWKTMNLPDVVEYSPMSYLPSKAEPHDSDEDPYPHYDSDSPVEKSTDHFLDEFEMLEESSDDSGTWLTSYPTLKYFDCKLTAHQDRLYLLVKTVSLVDHSQCWSTNDCVQWSEVKLPMSLGRCSLFFSHNKELYIIEADTEKDTSVVWKAIYDSSSSISGWQLLPNIPSSSPFSVAFPLGDHLIFADKKEPSRLRRYNLKTCEEEYDLDRKSPLSPLPANCNADSNILYPLVTEGAVHLACTGTHLASDRQALRWRKQILTNQLTSSKMLSSGWVTNALLQTPTYGSLTRAEGHFVLVSAAEPRQDSRHSVFAFDVANQCWRDLPSTSNSYTYNTKLFSGITTKQDEARESRQILFHPALACFKKQLVLITVQKYSDRSPRHLHRYGLKFQAETLDLSCLAV